MGTGSPSPPVVGDNQALEIRLLGGLQLRVGAEPLDALRSGRARALLGFLVLHAEVAHARQRLAFEFWPDSSEGQARTNLRNVLHTLRQAHPSIDASLRVTPTTLQWRPTGPTVLDVDRFVDAAHAATTADPDDPDELIARCRAALALYGGELLAGEHDQWLLPRRDELHDLHRDVLRLLATALIDHGRPREALALTRELVRVDPLDESAHQLRIEAHHAAADRAGAVRAYHECAATLERELGIEPSTATAAAYSAVLGAPGATAADREAAVPVRPALVGRAPEWQQLLGAWRDAARGRSGVVVVTGEPGIGKTRLVDDLRTWCARSGAIVGVARSYATEGDLGYGVVAAWLRSRGIRPRVRQLPLDQQAELARLLPELGAPVPTDGANDSERRRRIFDVAATAITGPSEPALLVVDDGQWSDQVSHEFIHYLVRRHPDRPLLVVLTARREELDAGHPLTALRDALALLDRVAELPLGRLSRDATAEIAGQLTGERLDDAAIEALFAETEGNPLFIVETIRAGWDGDARPAGLSPHLRAVIDARFHRLSEVATTVLGAAAVVARPCAASLLATICDLDDRSLARGLDELWHRGILRETGIDSYEFSHGKLRDAAYEDLSPVMRRAHHAAAAELFAQLAAHDPEVASSQVALHFEAANRPEQAMSWFQRAAIEAEQVGAYAEAVRLLDRALALVAALPADIRHVRELELLSCMPLALAGAEGYGTDRMREAHRRATNVAARLGVDLEPSVLRSMVMSALCRDEFDDAADDAARLLAHAADTGDASLRVESHYLLGIAAFWSARFEAAREHFELVVADFDPSTRAHHHRLYGHDPQVVCLSRLANTLWFLGRDDDARRACEDALALAEDGGHLLSSGTAVVFSCLLAIDAGDHELLLRMFPKLGTLGPDSLPFATKYQAMAGLVDVLGGRHDAGIARARIALDRCGHQNLYPGFQAAIARVLVAAHLIAGDAAGGLETCELALALRSTPVWDAELHRARAELLRTTGASTARIDSELRAAEAIARRQAADGHLRRIEDTRRRLGLVASPRALSE